MEFIREHKLLHRLVLVDGIGKCGKGLLSDIISCFSSVEKQDYNPVIEYISIAHKYNKISSDMAIAILKTQMDCALYNNMIGRQINSRLTDGTSLYSYHNPSKYISRSIAEEGSTIYKRVLEEKPIYLNWCHDVINKSDIIFEAFGRDLEFIYLNRRPIDIIYEWDKKGYSNRMAQDPTEMQYCIKYKNTTVPLIALDWEDEFLTCSALERTVKLIYSFFKLNGEELIKKQAYTNLTIFTFEDLVTNPTDTIEKIKFILGNDPLPALSKLLIKESCPRPLDEQQYLQRENKIRENLSPYYLDLLTEMNAMYENIKRLGHRKLTSGLYD